MDMESTSQFDSLVTDSELFEGIEAVGAESRDKPVSSETREFNDFTSTTKPYVGMEFDSLHQAFLFYNEYAAIVGFSVRKDKTRKSNVDGSYLFRRFCCSKEGYPRNNRENVNERFVQIRDGVAVKVELRIPPVPRLSRRAKIEMKRRAEVLQKMRVGCNAKLDVKRGSNGKWVVQKFVEEHNHECVSLGETHLLRSHRGRHITHGQNASHEGVELASPDELHSYIELNCVVPSVGMEFESHHKVFLFYNAYARVLGFIVRKDKTRKSNIDGSLLFRRFCCSREGYRRTNNENDNNERKQVRGGVAVKVRPRILPVTRVGCNAKMEVKRNSDGKWVVQKFIEEHNHEFDRFGDINLLRSEKKTQSTQGEVEDVATEEGPTNKKLIPSLLSKASGCEKVLSGKPRVRNRLSRKRKKKLEKGDLQVLFNYFRQMKMENPSFFYAVQVDDDDQMLNCFWADARSRLDFGYFGDVINFETSYGTSHYGRPFAPILGVNHHLQTVLFGCAIVLYECEESYAWLLETLLKAMCGHRPVRIITDQDEEMVKAIDRVLPGTHHCLSLRYIFQSTNKHLSHLYTNEVDFGSDFKRCVYESDMPAEFETKWAALLVQYELCKNEWLDNIYSKRHKWVPLYSKHTFQADMMTSQRSESIHSFFDDYLNRALSFGDFINQYEKALIDSREKEAYEDLKSHQTRHVLKTDLPMEKQAADRYSRSLFKEFHREFCDSFNYLAAEADTLETNRTFLVSRWEQNNSYTVNFSSHDNDICVSCCCLNFEFMGILCRHILRVFTTMNAMLIPEAYLKKRWTKRAKWGVQGDSNMEKQANYQNSVPLHYNELCHLALNISAKGAISLKAYQIAKSNIIAKLRELEKDDGEDTHTSMNQHDINGVRISRAPVEVIENTEHSEQTVTEDNHALSTDSQVGFYNLPRVRERGQPPKRITPLLGNSQSSKKARTTPDTSDNLMPSVCRRVVPEPKDPCHVGGVGVQDTQSHRLLNMCPSICVYACPPPGPTGDMNDQYHSSENAAFGEPFAGLPCIQDPEQNIFDLNQVGMRM